MSFSLQSFITANDCALKHWFEHKDDVTVGLWRNREVVVLKNTDSFLTRLAWKIFNLLGLIIASGPSIEFIKNYYIDQNKVADIEFVKRQNQAIAKVNEKLKIQNDSLTLLNDELKGINEKLTKRLDASTVLELSTQRIQLETMLQQLIDISEKVPTLSAALKQLQTFFKEYQFRDLSWLNKLKAETETLKIAEFETTESAIIGLHHRFIHAFDAYCDSLIALTKNGYYLGL